MNIRIETAVDEDAEEICRLLNISITSLCVLDHSNDPIVIANWLKNKTPENIRRWVKSNRSFCAKNEREKIVGFSLVSRNNEILLNYVLPEYQYKGVGTEMLSAMVKSVGSDMVIKVSSTKSALDFYIRNGFRETSPGSDTLEKKIIL